MRHGHLTGPSSTTYTFRQYSSQYFLEGKHHSDPYFELVRNLVHCNDVHTTPELSVLALSSAAVAYVRFEFREDVVCDLLVAYDV
jgi:hypothetical protein